MCEQVLVIDASPVCRLVIKAALRRQGVTCRCFAEGSEALHALAADPQLIPQVIVMELGFKAPEIGGFALLRLLRACPRLDKAAIVILTAQRGVPNRMRARLAGADEFLVKPFVQKIFLAVVLPYVPRAEDRPAQEQRAQEQRTPGEERHASTRMYFRATGSERYAS